MTETDPTTLAAYRDWRDATDLLRRCREARLMTGTPSERGNDSALAPHVVSAERIERAAFSVLVDRMGEVKG